MQTVHISEHMTYRKIFRLTYAPVLMMIFTSIYSIVDGVFISNVVGKTAFAGINLIFPITMIVGGIGFMLGTGGAALSSKKFGQQNPERANRIFSIIITFTLALGLIASVGGFFAVRPVARAMASVSSSASEEMIDYATSYGRILMLGQFAFMLQNVFQSYFMVAEKPRLGFLFTVAAGVTNMILDAILVWACKFGVIGAAFATVGGYLVGGFGPLIYFAVNKKGMLHLIKAKWEFHPIWRAITNGFSEFVSNISMNIVSIVFNIQLLKYIGENGVAAYGALMYISFIFISIFIGYSIGVAPVVGYNFGAKNHTELRNVLTRTCLIMIILQVSMCLLCGCLARPLAMIFARGDEELIALAARAMRINALSFLVVGMAIFSSSFFTALNNGLISAIISVCRTLIFELGSVLLLPLLVGGDGIWWSIVLSEALALLMAFAFLYGYRNRYGYGKNIPQEQSTDSPS